MNLLLFLDALCAEKIKFITDEPMKNHTSFKIGGNSDVFITPADTEQLSQVLIKAALYKIPYFVMGNGSNLLVSDEGIRGAVISLSLIDQISVKGERITCGAGAVLSRVCCAARDASLGGLEFAYGIPGSCAGALYMNAGAYGGEMAQVVESARYIMPDGQCGEIFSDKMQLGYRESIFRKNGMIITDLTVKLTPRDKGLITEKMTELMSRRREKQPLEFPSAGSTFKRPQGHFAGALIEKNGLKGMSVGAAQVSEKHAGFVINTGGATAGDVKALMNDIKRIVSEADGVELEPEVIFVGGE